jgi:hypothetical protein
MGKLAELAKISWRYRAGEFLAVREAKRLGDEQVCKCLDARAVLCRFFKVIRESEV